MEGSFTTMADCHIRKETNTKLTIQLTVLYAQCMIDVITLCAHEAGLSN